MPSQSVAPITGLFNQHGPLTYATPSLLRGLSSVFNSGKTVNPAGKGIHSLGKEAAELRLEGGDCGAGGGRQMRKNHLLVGLNLSPNSATTLDGVETVGQQCKQK